MKACAPDAPCPCRRMVSPSATAQFRACCGRYLDAGVAAPDAEHLMRSRYSAFVLEREAYLLATWHPRTRPVEVAFDATAKWLGLEVRTHRVLDADHAEVEFVARHKPASGGAVRLHELSRFVRARGVWLYVDGILD